jgi:hypothetical protein
LLETEGGIRPDGVLSFVRGESPRRQREKCGRARGGRAGLSKNLNAIRKIHPKILLIPVIKSFSFNY